MNHQISFFEIFLETLMLGNICRDSSGFGQCPKSAHFFAIVLASVETGKQKDNFVMWGGEGDDGCQGCKNKYQPTVRPVHLQGSHCNIIPHTPPSLPLVITPTFTKGPTSTFPTAGQTLSIIFAVDFWSETTGWPAQHGVEREREREC